ncbi:SIR2 family protein [Plantibacter sp. ME-Dv--P-122b]|uniref:SIR2 family protein n=1 Tax=Plantibacter sp. ME-Dv--P-122b TaxID=3040300 RepID=UPI00254C8256|nr:SIR2 family protein [Plantibacter sp. ME-Dv--P-122b]
MTELVKAVSGVGLVDAESLTKFGNDLEQWLSFLSVDQPWLTDADNLSNRASFIRITDEVYRQIVAAERSVVATAPPDWLLKFAWSQADASASVFTFNYDTLLERALSRINRVGTWADLYVAPITSRAAAASGLFLGPSDPRGSLPTIFKLHGSTSWAFGGLDAPTSDPIVLTTDLLPWAPEVAPAGERPPRYQHMYDDLKPLLIPPTYSKGPYLANRSLKAQWRAGAEALARAEELVIVGYSFPAGDLVARQWVASSAGPQTATVIDPDESVTERVAALLGPSVDITHRSSISDYVDGSSGPLLRWRVYLSADEKLGLQVDLHCDGVDLLSGVDRVEPPWNPFNETAREWLHTLLERLQTGINEMSVVEEESGGRLREAMFSVMPAGWILDPRVLTAALGS